MRVREAAAYIGIGESKMRQLAWNGEVPFKLLEIGVECLFVCLHHSARSALTGSTDAARSAGIAPATQVAASSMLTATHSALPLTEVSP